MCRAKRNRRLHIKQTYLIFYFRKTYEYEKRIEQCYETISGCASDVYRQVTHEHIERIEQKHCEVSPPGKTL